MTSSSKNVRTLAYGAIRDNVANTSARSYVVDITKPRLIDTSADRQETPFRPPFRLRHDKRMCDEAIHYGVSLVKIWKSLQGRGGDRRAFKTYNNLEELIH